MGQKKKIKILSPVDNFLEAKALVEEGADELYGGLFPSFFRDYPYFLSPNQRTFREAQMDEEELKRILELCKERNVPFYLTINQLYFKHKQLPLIMKLADFAISLGVSAFIMGSLPLIINVRERFPDFPIHLSTMGVALNHHSISFYENLNIRRVTLERSLLLKEIRGIISNSKAIEFDAFILIGKCPNVEGFCSLLHTNADKIWPCEQNYRLKGSEDIIKVQSNWQGFYRSQSCGICGIPYLLSIGIGALKIVGRGSSTRFKIENIKMIKEALSLEREIAEKKVLVKEFKKLYKTRFNHPCNSYCCYFPEIGFGLE
ncbi:MAG: U32 family peptidase [Proteobacteria bacterium]|nr:U32 family peptidase [Pseudomonadota bacterium]